MSRKHKFLNPDGAYFVTFTVQNWVDVFTRNAYKNILVESLAPAGADLQSVPPQQSKENN